MKKYSLKSKQSTNLKKTNSRDYFTTSATHNPSPAKKSSLKLHPLIMQKEKLRGSETKTDNSVGDLIGDPSLHGKIRNERLSFYKAMEGE